MIQTIRTTDALFFSDVLDRQFILFQFGHDCIVVENVVVARDVRAESHSRKWNLRETMKMY
jgi:hypothetical protein